MIKINSLKVSPDKAKNLRQFFCKKYKVNDSSISEFEIVKKSLDARKKDSICYILSLLVTADSKTEKYLVGKFKEISFTEKVQGYILPKKAGNIREEERPVIIGFGPAGIFCAYILTVCGFRPLVYERGSDIDSRTAAVESFWKDLKLNPETNVQFGEGGAGTFSDGKLNTGVTDKEGRKDFVLETLVKFGANKNICYDAKPHVGTDELRKVIKNIREYLIANGAEINFNCRFDGFETANGRISNIKIQNINSGNAFTRKCNSVILCIGHSARDTFEMLYRSKINMEPKPFAVGFRVEHTADFINRCQYGEDYVNLYESSLPTANYKLAYKAGNGRNVYSFCMCPGGYIVNASSEDKRCVVNGMSYSGRDGKNSNSAIVVSVLPEDFGNNDYPLCGMEYQRKIEESAYKLAQGRIPVEKYSDFYRSVRNAEPEEFDKNSADNPISIKGEYSFTDISHIYSKEINEAFIEGMENFDNVMKGFASSNPLLAGVETRTSSPVRMIRDEDFNSNIKGLYPCGEGAGYAGGIVSAAMDGIKTAEKIILSY